MSHSRASSGYSKKEIQVSTPIGTSKKLKSPRNLHDCLSQEVHAKYKLGSSNQDSVYFQLWKNCNRIEINLQ